VKAPATVGYAMRASCTSSLGTELFGHQLYAAVNILGESETCRVGGVVFEG
jgi:hypothetical protein